MIFLHQYSFFKQGFKFFCELLSIDKGETATGNGFRLPLVISTSIKLYALIGKNKIIINCNK